MDRAMTNPASSTPQELLRRITVAGWGVAWGVLIAAAITCALIQFRDALSEQPHPDLLASDYLSRYDGVFWQERYEHTWYALACVLGALGGWIATRFLRPSGWLVLPAVIAFVPAAAWVCRGVFKADVNLDRFLATAAILALPLYRRTAVPGPSALPDSLAPTDTARPGRAMWYAAAILCVPLGLLVYGVAGPHHVATVASECNCEPHVASYIVAPALYFRAPGVVPGLDFESHYGVGHAYAFSFVMGRGGLQKTLERYVLFVLVVCILYYLSAFLVLADWFRSVVPAFAGTLLLIFLASEGVGYSYPSCSPVRHPFLFAFVFAAVRGVGPRGTSWCAASGAIAGLSLFWQTDVGLYTLAAGAAFYLGVALFLRVGVARPAVFLAAGLGTFAALCVLAFGPRVLSIDFVERLLEPLLLYATGFGNKLMNWKPGWGYWYNLLGPCLAVATVAVMLGYGRRTLPPRAVLYGAATSLVGLAMLFKWVNRSLDVLWSLNGGLVAVVAAWWMWLGWRALAARLASENRPWVGVARQFAAAMALLALTYVAVRMDVEWASAKSEGGRSSPIVRAADRISEYRGPINAARKGIRPSVHASPTDPASTRYLKTHTRGTERVAVICEGDWNYLADAGRSPRLSWLPLFLIHSPILLERCANDLRNSDRIFFERNSLSRLKALNAATHDVVVAILAEQFELVEDTPTRWIVYRRKPGHSASR
jgi:hypothetical protein